jgi:hypothetical protein
VSAVEPVGGWCFVCNTSIDADTQAHVEQEHSGGASKPKTPKISWQHRTRNVIGELQQVLDETDPTLQMRLLDGVIQDLNLVRVRLGELKRASLTLRGS